ncbi:amidase [Phaeacidiphilus oryzae]|uniref:amidase n=1 Tax=Phaeacidiphilus oryzae TaxID=348818 RepID=UPI0005661A96|nr:amidase [Phaeacidiphilus oryzae]
MTQLHDLTALEQARMIREGDLSPVELADHYLARIERHSAELGAYTTPTPELARKQAADAESEATAARREGRALPPLHGVPCPIKDLNNVAGVRTTFGSAAFAEYTAEADDHVVTRLRAAGTVILGKTNTPEFGLPCHTENDVAPPARTPWDLERSAGGSSGGAGAAVASGLAPLAHGSDGGGSVRIPAAVCGLFGIKPSRGRISAGPVQHDVTGLSTSGPLARTVADAAALLDAMAGAMPGDPYAAPSPAPGDSFLAAADREPGPLRIALLTAPLVPGLTVHQDCLAAAQETAELLGQLGHQVEPLELPAGDDYFARMFTTVWEVSAAARPVPEGGEELLLPLTRSLRERGRAVPAARYHEALYSFRAMGQLVAGLLAPEGPYDVILSPTLAQPPAPVGGLRNDADPVEEFRRISAFTPFTPVYNATGLPAVNVPVHWNPDGLPIGTMLGARYGAEALLISLSAQLERARPWSDRRPEIWAG